MATEAYYQNKIIKAIEDFGGIAINGVFTKKGEADLQCGILYGGKLLHLAVEVKTPEAYNKLMSGITVTNGLYEITDRSKIATREVLQIHKINRNRELEGKALFAYAFDQILDYISSEDI